MSDFKPLDMQRAIRDDCALRGSEKGLLWSAVLRTDNRTRRVRASLELLAKDAGYHPNTAKVTFHDDNKPVMRYFEKVERSKREVNLWFHSTVESTVSVRSKAGGDPEDTVSVRSESDGGPESTSTVRSEVDLPKSDPESTVSVRSENVWEVAARSRAQSVCGESTTTVRSPHSECAPSASICSTSAASHDAASPLTGDKQALDTETPSGPHSEEPSSDNGIAPEESHRLGGRRHLGNKVAVHGEAAPEPARYRGRGTR